MKVKLFILVFFLCSLFNGLGAQTYSACPNDWVEVIVVFPNTTPIGVIGNLRIKVGFTPMDSIPTLKAYLWRICKGSTIDRVGLPSLTINSASDAITHINNGASSIGITLASGSANSPTSANVIAHTPLQEPFDGVHLLARNSSIGGNDKRSTFAQTYLDVPIHSENPVSIFVLDSGNKGGRNSTGGQKVDRYLNSAKGWCFITNTGNPLDGAGHGTSVISIIANIFNELQSNGMIIPSNTITSVRVLDNSGKGQYWQYLKGFAYALNNGAQIINSSVIIKSETDVGEITPIDIAINRAQSLGVMVIAGSGNDITRITRTTNTIATGKINRFLPADITNDYLITVGASNDANNLAYFSNFGKTGSLMAAPGLKVKTMDYSSPYIREASGTSFATPFVTAAYAVLKYMSPTSDPMLLKSAILNTTTNRPNFTSCDFGILNMFSACQSLQETLCPRPATPSVSSITPAMAIVNWAPSSGAQSYNVEYQVTGTSTWTTITDIGTTSCTLTDLLSNTSYNVRITVVCSAISSVASMIRSFTTSELICTDVEPNGTLSTAKKIFLNTDLKAKIATNSDVDWYRITALNGQLTGTQLTVTLRELPANYDLFLYNAAGILQASSRQAGNANESLVFTTLSGIYYIKVVGVSGSFNANNCYILRASIPTNTDIWDISPIQLRSQTANSGTTNSFPIKSVAGLDMTVFPNPTTTDQFSININSDEIGQASLTIFDMMGRTVWGSPELMLEKGQTVQAIDFSKQNNGLYMVQIIKGKMIKTHKLFLSR